MKKIIKDENYIADAKELCQLKIQENGLLVYYKSGDTYLFKDVKPDVLKSLLDFLLNDNLKIFDMGDYKNG